MSMDVVGRRYDTGETVTLVVAGERIAEIRPAASSPPASAAAEPIGGSARGTHAAARLPWIAPGFVDLQVNGTGGIEFSAPSLTTAGVAQVTAVLDRQGVTAYCPTLTTNSYAVLEHALGVIAQACRESAEVAARIIGVHLEGPYISAEDGPRGAHPRPHVRPPDWDEFRRLQDAAQGAIRIVTLSPEYAEAGPFIRQAVAAGVLVALGHTQANSDQIRAAVDDGARLSTHLGNGAHGYIRRHPNYIWDQLAEDRLTASLIADGYHLPGAVVKCFLRAKTPDRCILVSDLSSLAGLPPGRYDPSGLGTIEILEDGRLVVAGQRQILAGAAWPLTAGIANVLRFSDVALPTAIDMASRQPAALLGIEAGGLTPGARADLVLFDLPLQTTEPRRVGNLEVRATIRGGRMNSFV